MTAEVVEAYDGYVEARRELRQRAREGVLTGLSPHLVAFGKAVQQAQDDGLSIAEIARLLDIKNRNFIYDAKRAYANATGEEYKVRDYVRSPKIETEAEERNYTIERIEKDCFEVKAFSEDYYVTTDEDGHFLFPEEWADAPDYQRRVFKEIIADIKERV